MTFDALLPGTEVFLDANALIYHFTNHAKYGPACTRLLERIEHQELRGYVSSHGLADVAHRLMTVEAMNRLGWPMTRLAARLKKHHDEIPSLTEYRQALVKLGQVGVRVLPVTESLVVRARRTQSAVRTAHGRRAGGRGDAIAWPDEPRERRHRLRPRLRPDPVRPGLTGMACIATPLRSPAIHFRPFSPQVLAR